MIDRRDDERFGELLGETIARRATSVSTRPNEEALFARVGARAARQRRVVAAAAVVAVAVSSLVGYSVGTTNRDGDSTVQTPVADQNDPGTSVSPAPGDPGYAGSLEHLFTRTANGITVRVYSAPAADPSQSSDVIVAEMSNDAAVGVGRLEQCGGGGIGATGTFGGPEGSPVEWVIVESVDDPGLAGQPVRALFNGGADEMIPVGRISVLVAPGAGGTVFVEGPAGAGSGEIGGPEGSPVECPPFTPSTTPSTLPHAGPQPADVAQAEAGVRQAYVDVYDNYTPPIGNSNVQGDERVLQALRAASYTDEQLAAMTVEVGEIRFTDETHAALQFRLTIPGHMDGTQSWRVGYAVFQDGRWTQARETYCDDLRTINVACP